MVLVLLRPYCPALPRSSWVVKEGYSEPATKQKWKNATLARTIAGCESKISQSKNREEMQYTTMQVTYVDLGP